MAYRRTLYTLSKHVRLDVGGIEYHFSSSLVGAHPNSRLASFVRDAERGRYDAERGRYDAAFVDRNGGRFEYVLDYLRDGKVHLPAHVSKDAFLADLKYFGIESVEENVVTSSFPIALAFDEILKVNHQNGERMRLLRCELAAIKIASMCFKTLVSSYTEYEVDVSSGLENRTEYDLVRDCSDDFRSVLGQEMAKCGLVFLDVAENYHKTKLTVRFERLGQQQQP